MSRPVSMPCGSAAESQHRRSTLQESPASAATVSAAQGRGRLRVDKTRRVKQTKCDGASPLRKEGGKGRSEQPGVPKVPVDDTAWEKAVDGCVCHVSLLIRDFHHHSFARRGRRGRQVSKERLDARPLQVEDFDQ